MAVNSAQSRALFLGLSVSTVLVSTALIPARAQTVYLDPITIVATRTEELAINSLAAVSTIRADEIERTRPDRVSDLFVATPGVTFQDRADEPGNAVNIRGLQDFGRVAVLIDGARQNASRTGHFAQGFFYLEPEMIGGVDVVRGPVANIYGSGAIGGVVSIRTKEAGDILAPGQRWVIETQGTLGNNTGSGVLSSFGAYREANYEFIAGVVHRDQSKYADGTGYVIANSWQQSTSGLLKATFRPADGHSITAGVVMLDTEYNFGQPTRPPLALNQGTSIYATDTKNYTTNIRWRYERPDDNIFNWDANVYWNRTDSNQLKIAHNSTTPAAYCGGLVPGNNITGCVGDLRGFQTDTVGFDVNNTSRFQTGNWKHAFTYGGDYFNDSVSTFDPRGTGDLTTPGGRREVFGGFLQWKGNYLSWLEVIGAVRYDQYIFNAAGQENNKSRFSPKITIGVTPVTGVQPYVSYAEGYRSPTLTETLVIGAHPTGGGPGAFVCPDGNPGFFCFAQNLNLRPEIGRNKEIGVNFKYDSVLRPGDAFRAKLNVFRNDIDDFIELTGFGAFNGMYGTFNFYQYQNISQARIEGAEFESTYDAGDWFAGLAAQYQRGKNLDTNVGLVNVQPNKVVTTLGFRFFERKLTASIRWAAVASHDDLPANYIPTDSYHLVNVYMSYKVSEFVQLGFNIDNLLNENYHPYPIIRSTPTDNQNDSLWASAAPGITFKGSLKIRYGDTNPPLGSLAQR